MVENMHHSLDASLLSAGAGDDRATSFATAAIDMQRRAIFRRRKPGAAEIIAVGLC